MGGTMIVDNVFIPNGGVNGTAPPWFATPAGASGAFPPGSPGNICYGPDGADGGRPSWFGGSGSAPPALGMSGILAQLASAVQQYIGKLGNALLGNQSATSSAGN